ncbi:MAG: hypothetical protein R3F02_04880 [Thiolinea sp.]
MSDSIPEETAKKQPGYFGDLLMHPARQEPISKAADVAVRQLNDAKTDDVKGIAASQISLLSRFYDLSLEQAGRSFRWALIASVVGLLFFMAAIVFQVLGKDGSELPLISVIGGALIEFIAGINFYLYGKTLSQLTLFQGRLEVTQRFLLANSLCESLGEKYRDETRAALIAQLASNEPYKKLSSGFHDFRPGRRDSRSDTDNLSGHPASGHRPE